MTIKKLAEIGTPVNPITSKSELSAAITIATQKMRRNRRNEDVRKARIDKINKEFDERANALNAELNPLFDQIFSYVDEHWDELALPTSPKTVYTNSADFKKHIDTRGTKTIDQKAVIEFIQNIDDNPVLAALRNVLGNSIIDTFVQGLKATMATEVITVVDETAAKQVSKDYPEIPVDGVEVRYNDPKITMLPHPSVYETRVGIKPQVVERKCSES